MAALDASAGVGRAPHSGALATDLDDDDHVFTFVLVKLASRCNINCTYCYWFRDADVYKKPPVLTVDAQAAFCKRLEQHIVANQLERFTLVFHGGEPLLFPKHRFVDLQKALLGIEKRTGCEIERGVCTNAILIDPEWAQILTKYEVSVSVSVDGPPDIHDANRVDFKGKGTHAETLQGIAHLRAVGCEPGLISVCNPATDPRRILAYVVDELDIKQFDILPPDASHLDDPPPIADYFIALFDEWYDKYAARGVRISTLDAMIQGLMGSVSMCDTIGLGPIDTVTLMTDGSLEPLDVLRIVGNGSTATDSNVFLHPLQHMQTEPRWSEAYRASTKLCGTCMDCEYLDACGGGHLAQRWSKERRFDNPSVYCDSWKRIFDHIWARISPTLLLRLEQHDAAKLAAMEAAMNEAAQRAR